MREVVTEAADLTPAWLTGVLARTGAIGDVRVVAVDASTNPAFNSSVAHLSLRYDRADAVGPQRLVLKTNRDGWGEAEVGVYRLAIGSSRPVPALVPCYHAAYDPGSGASTCLLLDLSETQ